MTPVIGVENDSFLFSQCTVCSVCHSLKNEIVMLKVRVILQLFIFKKLPSVYKLIVHQLMHFVAMQESFF